MSTTIVKDCTCRHPFQDERYGSGKRLMNRSQKKDKQFARCTVCGREHSTAKAIKAVVVTEK